MSARIFISYSHHDEGWKDQLVTQLKVLALEGLWDVWDDRHIAAGETWQPEIAAAIAGCDVAILLVSAEFLTSGFIRSDEIPALLQRRQHEGVRLIPLIAQPCAWQQVPWLADVLQCRPTDGVPLQELYDKNGPSAAVAALADLARELASLMPTGPRALPAGPSLRALGGAEAKARSSYLRGRQAHVRNLLAASIHSAVFIDLGIDDTRAAANPGHYHDTSGADLFDNLADAFEQRQRRLLVLGQPGGGKSTGLLQLADQLINSANASADAPVPLLVNLSKFNLDAAATAPAATALHWRTSADGQAAAPDRRIEDWLVEELATLKLPREMARRWLAEDRVLLLLDGLDEVNDQRRAELARLLNTSLLRQHPEAAVVVCSRTDDYRPLADSTDTRLALAGAVTLQPLTPAQINTYLQAAKATGLADALAQDPALRTLAETPLTLSMMTLAYAGLGAADIPHHASAALQRHALMATFVARMLQRKERRDRQIPFDRSQQLEVAPCDYGYAPATVDRTLGWLAVQMSVRMQTTCSTRRFHHFISLRRLDGAATPTLWLAQAVLLLLAGLAPALVLAPWTLAGALTALALAAAAPVLMLAGWAAQQRWPVRLHRNVMGGSLLGLTGVAALGLLANGLVQQLPVPVQAEALAVLLLGGALLPLLALIWLQDPGERRLAGSMMLGALAGCALGWWGAGWTGQAVTPADLAAIGLVGGLALATLLGRQAESLSDMAVAAMLLVGAAGLAAGSAWLMPAPGWWWALATQAALLLGLAWLADVPWLLVAGAASATTVGAVLGGALGAIAAPLGAGVLLMLGVMVDNKQVNKVGTDLVDDLDAGLDRWLLSPLLRACLAAARRLPLRLRPFQAYAADALLLKPTGSDLEFSHRRLRDYFALRELMPGLDASNPALQLQAIDALGFQGAAAIDPLAELAHSGPLPTRLAALRAISRIAAPEVEQHMLRAFDDPEPQVRRCVLQHLHNLPGKVCDQLLDRAAQDDDALVRHTAVQAMFTAPRAGGDLSSRVKTVLRQGQGDLELLRNLAEARALHPRSRVHIGRSDEALAWVGHSLPQLLQQPDTQTLRGALMLASGVRSDGVETACIALLHGSPAPDIRALAATALGGRHGGDARIAAALLAALEDRSVPVRNAAIQALPTGDAGPVVAALLRILAGREVVLRRSAAQTLGWRHAPQAVTPLRQALGDRDGQVRAAAAEALGRLGDPAAVPDLITALRRRDRPLQIAAAEALGVLGDARAIVPLTALLAHRQHPMQRAAALALARLDQVSAVPVLLATLQRARGYDYIAETALRRFANGPARAQLVSARANASSPEEIAALDRLLARGQGPD